MDKILRFESGYIHNKWHACTGSCTKSVGSRKVRSRIWSGSRSMSKSGCVEVSMAVGMDVGMTVGMGVGMGEAWVWEWV